MILSKTYLQKQTNLAHSQFSNREVQIMKENTTIFSETKKYDVFLSHSYLDKELVLTLVELFNKSHYSVYVDWIDDPLLDRTNVTPITAERLRIRMENCKSLAYIATTNTVSSKWCPWELGYVDGKKGGRCAILPILATTANTFKGQEYLGLYPYIDYTEGSSSYHSDFWVNSPTDKNKYTSLRNWLNGKDPVSHT